MILLPHAHLISTTNPIVHLKKQVPARSEIPVRLELHQDTSHPTDASELQECPNNILSHGATVEVNVACSIIITKRRKRLY